MNLGQSVAVCAYELARSGVVSIRPPSIAAHPSSPANLQTLDHLFDRAAQLLDVSGYLHPRSRAATLIKLRRFLLDLNLSCSGARILGGVLTQVEWKLKQTGPSTS
jgi:tRNA C32,U32 (ribose-2'-O)-methylase TrmJ